MHAQGIESNPGPSSRGAKNKLAIHKGPEEKKEESPSKEHLESRMGSLGEKFARIKREEERARLSSKLSTGIVNDIWLQFSNNCSWLEKNFYG